MKKGGIGIVVAVAIALGLVIAGGAYMAGRYSVGQQKAVTPVVYEAQPTLPPADGIPDTIVPTQTSAKVETKIQLDSTIPSVDIPDLNGRVINPLVDYYKEANQGELVSLTISVNPHASKLTYPYQGSAVLSSGGNMGFLVSQTNGKISWWVPECMSQCPLSAEYKLKYPEVAKILGY